MQFIYTAYRVGTYVAPMSTVLSQSTIVEGDELFLALLVHFRIHYPEVYGSAVATGRAPERRELQIGDGGGLTGRTIVHSSIKLGAYASRFTNLILAGMNKPIPNLTTVYLDTPLVGLTPDPLEYVPLPGRVGKPSGYPFISTGGGPSTVGLKSCFPPPPPLHITHPRIHPPTGRAQPRRVM